MTTSVTVVNMLPALDKWLPYPNNNSIEVDEGHSIEFTCIYNASTNPNVTMATWNFEEDYLKHNSSHHTMTTEYGTDPANAKRILSRLILLNVVPDDTGTYTCQCVYNSDIIYNKEMFCSATESFHVKVKPKVKSGQHYYEVSCALVFLHIGYTLYIIIGGTVGLVLAVLSMISLTFLVRRRQKMKSKIENRASGSDETDQSDDESGHTNDKNGHNNGQNGHSNSNGQNGHNSGQNIDESDQSSDDECAPLVHKS